MKTILCEKPSQAEDIARCLDKNYQKQKGCFMARDFHITYAIGHLLELIIESEKSTEKKKWSLDDLPIKPEDLCLQIVKEKDYQFMSVRSILLKSNQIIVATDAGREGELLAREILEYCKIDKSKCYRIWSSISMTSDVLNKCLENLQPLSDFDSIYQAAQARQFADTLLGFNLSRYFTIKAQSAKAYSVGRVQTPTLRVVVEREKAIESFKEKEFFIIKGVFSPSDKEQFTAKYSPCEQYKDENLPDGGMNKENATAVLNLIKEHNTATILKINKESVSENSPGLLNLTDLQILSNKKFGYSSSRTLEIAQNLYEKHKCISYPRSDSSHMGEENKALVKEKLHLFAPSLTERIDKVGKRVFDNSKLTDHHALIPLLVYKGSDPDETNIFSLIRDFFIMTFMDSHIYEKTDINIQIANQYNFFVIGKTISQLGWKRLLSTQTDDTLIPDVQENEELQILDIQEEKKKTFPPKRHTEASLLTVMKKYKLGTVATRQDIIKNLFDKVFFIQDKKNILPSEKGKDLIEILLNSQVSNIKYTGMWEDRLDKISSCKDFTQAKKESQAFISEIMEFINQQFTIYKNVEIKSYNPATPQMLKLAKKLAREKKRKDYDNHNSSYDYVKAFIDNCLKESKEGVNCPCGKGKVYETPKTFKCSCNRVVFKESLGKKITQKQALALFGGEHIKLSGCKSQKGKTFNAIVELCDNNGKLNIVSFSKK